MTEEISSVRLLCLTSKIRLTGGLAAGIQLYLRISSSCIGKCVCVCDGAQRTRCGAGRAAKSQLLQFIVIVIAMTMDKASQLGSLLRVPMRGWVDLSMTMSPISSRIDTQTGILTTQCGRDMMFFLKKTLLFLFLWWPVILVHF